MVNLLTPDLFDKNSSAPDIFSTHKAEALSIYTSPIPFILPLFPFIVKPLPQFFLAIKSDQKS
jgi:hypothetical protein